jgi:hypothetical protein
MWGVLAVSMIVDAKEVSKSAWQHEQAKLILHVQAIFISLTNQPILPGFHFRSIFLSAALTPHVFSAHYCQNSSTSHTKFFLHRYALAGTATTLRTQQTDTDGYLKSCLQGGIYLAPSFTLFH